MGIQLASHPDKVGGESLGADVVVGLSDDAQSPLHLWPIGGAALVSGADKIVLLLQLGIRNLQCTVSHG